MITIVTISHLSVWVILIIGIIVHSTRTITTTIHSTRAIIGAIHWTWSIGIWISSIGTTCGTKTASIARIWIWTCSIIARWILTSFTKCSTIDIYNSISHRLNKKQKFSWLTSRRDNQKKHDQFDHCHRVVSRKMNMYVVCLNAYVCLYIPVNDCNMCIVTL